MVIEAGGLRFVAESARLEFVADLHVDVETRCGESVLVVSHPTWTRRESC